MKSKQKISRILYVEDEDDLRDIVSVIIKKNFDIQIDALPSGNSAIEILESGITFDLIISDYRMPNGSGADLQRYMKHAAIKTPFILYTSTINPYLPEKSDQFLGVIEKSNWEKLLTLIQSTLKLFNGE